MPVTPSNTHWRTLRHAIVASHGHWDRPVTLDATFKRELGDRARHDKAAADAETKRAR